jgi:mRNA interferase MazF
MISMLKGEIWLINLDPTMGSEIRKTRPALIVSEDAIGILPLRVIVPITDWKERYAIAPWLVFIPSDAQNGLTKDSAADAFQIRSVSQERFIRKIGFLHQAQVAQVIDAIQVVIGVR